MARLLSKSVYRANAPISTVPAPCAASGGAASSAPATNRMARVIMRNLLASALRGNDDHTVGRPRAVDAGRPRVLQDPDTSDVGRPEAPQPGGLRSPPDRDAVDAQPRV